MSIIVGFVLGIVGQGLRTLVGLYKTINTPGVSVSDWTARRVIVTILIGGIAGVLVAIVFPWGTEMSNLEKLAVVAAGYSGTDFIEGIMEKFVPKSTAPSEPSPRVT